jgi:hypothetical protein
MQTERLPELFAFAVNTLGGGIVGSIVALCMVKTESAREGVKRSIVSVAVSGASSVATMRYLKWKWPTFPDDYEVRFLIQLVWGVFGYHVIRWTFNEFEGTEGMRLSTVLRGGLKAFGPILSRLGNWSSSMGGTGKEEGKP